MTVAEVARIEPRKPSMTDSDTFKVCLLVAFLCGTIQFSPEFRGPLWIIYTFPVHKAVTCCSSARREFEVTRRLLSAISEHRTLDLEKLCVMVARYSSSELWRFRLNRLYTVLVRIAPDSNFSAVKR